MSETTDSTFYRSPAAAIEAPPEKLAYVAAFDPAGEQHDAMTVIDCDPESSGYGAVVGWAELPTGGNELHHFGWNACSSALCHEGHEGALERRYLIVPGLRSSRTYVLDTKDDPRSPQIVKTIEPEEIAKKTGYSRAHTVHCGPDGIYVNALGNPEGDGPGGIFVLDHDTLEVKGAWESDRGPQELAYDFWWHLGYDRVISSEWGTPNMIEGGVNPELLLGNKYGHRLHVWDMKRRRHVQKIDLGPEHQMILELRPAHDPDKAYGFAGCVVSTADLSASVFLWERCADGSFGAKKVISIPAEPADPDQLPDALKPFGAVPPLVSDIALSVDDRSLYVSCWGTGELKRFDVSDPHNPRESGSVRIGGIVGRSPHPAAGAVNGGPQMVEVSRDGRRVYLTNSLYRSWDEQFYPDGIRGWLAKLDAGADGSLTVDPDLFVEFPEGERPHQVRLQGGDASSDSYCFPNGG